MKHGFIALLSEDIFFLVLLPLQRRYVEGHVCERTGKWKAVEPSLASLPLSGGCKTHGVSDYQ